MHANTSAERDTGQSNATTAATSIAAPVTPGGVKPELIENIEAALSKQSGSATIAAPSITAPVTPGGIEPEFCAFPGPGQVEPYGGLKRGMLYQLAREGHIKTVSLRLPGKTRGRRLVVLRTLRDFLRRLDAEQNAGVNREGQQ